MRLSGGLAVALVSAALIADTALAADIASFRSIGFSDDGSVYAFEEYGVQDGSGFPFSNVFFINTQNDTFLPGTPIRVRLEDEDAGLSKARVEAATRAAPLVDKFDLNSRPGLLAAFNPITETESPANRLAYREYASEPAFGREFVLTLKEQNFPAAENCKEMTLESPGFSLLFESEGGKPSGREVYADTKIPDSRTCPTGYRLGGVIVDQQDGKPATHVVLVHVLSVGFEGHDGRWIAVPVHVAP